MHVAFHAPAGDDFQSVGRNGAVDSAADNNGTGLDLALEVTLAADHNVRFRLHVAFDAAIDVQGVAQGEIADKLGAGRDDG